jgi:hypothetical protein
MKLKDSVHTTYSWQVSEYTLFCKRKSYLQGRKIPRIIRKFFYNK